MRGKKDHHFQKQMGNFPWDSFAMESKELCFKSSQVTGRESAGDHSRSLWAVWPLEGSVAGQWRCVQHQIQHNYGLYKPAVQNHSLMPFFVKTARSFWSDLEYNHQRNSIVWIWWIWLKLFACLEHFSPKLREIIMFCWKLISNEVYF